MKRFFPSGFFDRWLWLCPVLAVLLAAALLWSVGFTWWSALLAAVLLVCPALLLWGAAQVAWTEWRGRHRRPDRHSGRDHF